jgi:hypothetical protein
MALAGTRAQDITETTLRALMNAQVPEGKTIDYKASLPGNTDGSKRDFLADLCSFANAAGGHIVYGMEEEAGLPTKVTSLAVDIDQAILRLDSMARDGIRPPIPGLEFIRVPLAMGSAAIVAIIPKSWNPPHQVIFQRDNRFYSRGSAGKQHVDVDELRRIVLFSQEIGERVRQLRAGRVAAVMSNDTPVTLQPGARQILHFVPLGSFAPGAAVDLKPIAENPAWVAMNGGGSVRFNVDGLCAYSPTDNSNSAYNQVFRNGVIEAVRFWSGGPTKTVLPSVAFERDVFAKTKGSLGLLDLAGIVPPIAVLLSFIGIKGWTMAVRDPWHTRGNMGGFDRDPLLIPELVLETLHRDDVPRLVRPILDNAWQAAGYQQSDHYDEQGNWIGQ